MQYLLTQDELDNLVPQAELAFKTTALEVARKIIMKEAKENCIHDKTPEWVGYADCGKCPCSSLREGEDHKVMKQICTLEQRYSKWL